jgi:putative hemolysin
LIVMLAMIAVNGVLAGYEIALASVSVARLEALARAGAAGAKAALAMKRSIERSLAAVQVGITLVGVIAAATGGAGAEENILPLLLAAGVPSGLANPLAIAIVVVPLTAATLVVGELVPKVFSLRNKEWVCLRLSPLMIWLIGSLWPVVWVLEKSVMAIMNWGSRWRPGVDKLGKSEAAEIQEIRAAAALARTSKLIGVQEENIIVNAARLSSRPVREIMLPAQYISMIAVDISLEEALVAGHLDLHTRFPVTERPADPQAILGYVNYKDIVASLRLARQQPSLRAIARPIPRMHEGLMLSVCLEQLIRDHSHIALVSDDADRVVGMVTLEDVIEELVGEIQDEYDRLPGHALPSGTAWVVGGGISLARLRELTGLGLARDPAAPAAQTLSQWFVERLGRPARGGDVVVHGACRVAVRKIRRQQVYEAQVSREEP